MNQLLGLLGKINEFIALETQDAKQIDDQTNEYIKLTLGMDHKLRDAYYTDTNLILTDIDDYREIMERSDGCEVLFKIETHFNEGIYILSYINNKRIRALLGGGNI